MKRLKTNELGGHPLTLQDFGFIQESWFEGFKQVVKTLVGDTPCILWGLEEKLPTLIGFPPLQTWRIEISSGAYWDGNEILLCSGGFVFNNSPLSPLWYVHIEDNTALPPLVYKNGISKNVYLEKILVVDTYTLSLQSFPISSIPRFYSLVAQQIGIGGIIEQIDTLQSNYNTLSLALTTVQNSLASHINSGGHDWAKISSKPIVDVGSFTYTDLNTNDYSFTVLGKNFGTINYAVFVSHQYTGNINNASNDMAFSIVNQTQTGFTIMMSDPLNAGGHLPAGVIRYIVYKL